MCENIAFAVALSECSEKLEMVLILFIFRSSCFFVLYDHFSCRFWMRIYDLLSANKIEWLMEQMFGIYQCHMIN